MSEEEISIEEKLASDPRLKPFLYFKFNVLDIMKLVAGDSEELAQAGRNLVHLCFEKWANALWDNLEESRETEAN